jgi:hypothetical protein
MSENNTQHWLWVAFSSELTLLYGCLVYNADPEARVPNDGKYNALKLDNTKVKIIEALIDDNEAQLIVNALREQCVLDVSGQNGPCIAVGGSRHRLADGFGRRARPMETYAGAELPKLSDKGWLQLLDFLKNCIGVEFRKSSDRLAAFDVYDFLDPNDNEHHIEFRVDRSGSPKTLSHPTAFILSADGTYVNSCLIHVELELGAELVFSKLVTLKPATSEQITAVPFDRYRISVFDPSGSLIGFQEHSLLLRIDLNLSTMGPTHSINDPLARSSRGLRSEIQDRASKVRTRSTNRTRIGAEVDSAFEVHQTTMRALTHRLIPPSGSDRWFRRGVEDEVGVIAYFNTLLDGARVSAGIIVDPYFGIDTLKRVILRLESLDVDVTVVTSLLANNPETNEPNPDLINELQAVLHDLQNRSIPNAAWRLTVRNLVAGPRQAFHDRYLMLTTHEGEREVYLLSNSLNRMAGKWPFCMSKLEGTAAREAAHYIDGLANGRDISGSTQPMTTFLWPSDDRP